MNGAGPTTTGGGFTAGRTVGGRWGVGWGVAGAVALHADSAIPAAAANVVLIKTLLVIIPISLFHNKSYLTAIICSQIAPIMEGNGEEEVF